MKNADQDSVVVHDRASRRRFIRTGTAFVLASGSVVSSGKVFADDCDRRRGAAGQPPKQAGNGSDSDSGDNSDPAGCGRQEPPKITRLDNTETDSPLLESHSGSSLLESHSDSPLLESHSAASLVARLRG